MKNNAAKWVICASLLLASCGQVPKVQQSSAESSSVIPQETELRSRASRALWSASEEQINKVSHEFEEFKNANSDATKDEQEAFLISELVKLTDGPIQPQEFSRGEELACVSLLFASCLKARQLADQATSDAEYSFGSWQPAPQNDDNEKNSFKHSWWNALMVKYIGSSDANTIATNHERYSLDYGTPPSDMDLYNNSIGRQYGSNYYYYSDYNLKVAVLGAVKRGEMRILKRGYNRYSAPFVASNYYMSTWGPVMY